MKTMINPLIVLFFTNLAAGQLDLIGDIASGVSRVAQDLADIAKVDVQVQTTDPNPAAANMRNGSLDDEAKKRQDNNLTVSSDPVVRQSILSTVTAGAAPLVNTREAMLAQVIQQIKDDLSKVSNLTEPIAKIDTRSNSEVKQDSQKQQEVLSQGGQTRQVEIGIPVPSGQNGTSVQLR